jgi:hypothetical protein
MIASGITAIVDLTTKLQKPSVDHGRKVEDTEYRVPGSLNRAAS